MIMALINWSDNLSVNVKEIDNQHKQLIAMINELDEAMRNRKGRDILGKIITNMINYTAHHFSTEEKYFAQYGYPATEEHMKEHRAFVDKVNDFNNKFDKARIGLTTDVINFLSDWLKRHIQGTDKNTDRF